MVRLRSHHLFAAATIFLLPFTSFAQDASTTTTPPRIIFSAPKTVNISWPISNSIKAFGDLNGDGKTDVITDNAVYLGNGNGGFSIINSTIQSEAASNAALRQPVDLNGDRKLDEVTFQEGSFDSDSCQVTEPANIAIWLGNGHGEFNFHATYDLPIADFANVTTGDFNHDGKPDLAVFAVADDQCFDTSELVIFINKGDGNFKEGQIIDLPGYYGHMVTGDFNGDGKIDLALSGQYATLTGKNTYTSHGIVQTYEGNGDGSFRTGTKYIINPNSAGAMLAADLNGDKRTDLVVFTTPANYPNQNPSDKFQIVTLLAKPDGNFYWSSAVTLPAVPYPAEPQLVDFNGDGKPDLLLPFNLDQANDAGGSSIEVLTGEGNGEFSAPQGFAAESNLNSAAAFPLTTGGRPDILFSATPTHKSFGLLVNESK